MVLRSIMADPLSSPSRPDDVISPSREWMPLNKLLWLGLRAPRQRQQRHVVPVPFTYRLRPSAHEGMFYRLGLADRDMQSEQNHGDRIAPFAKAQIAEGIQQDRAGQDDQGIGEDEIFGFQPAPHAERIDSDRGQQEHGGLDRGLFFAARPSINDAGYDQPGEKHGWTRRGVQNEGVARENRCDPI